jgi:hypothetical protein
MSTKFDTYQITNHKASELLTFLDDEEQGYEDARNKLKLDWLPTSVLVFQATVGISLYTLHQPLSKAGLYLGGLITPFVWYLATYGLQFYEIVARGIEEEAGGNLRIKNPQELCSRVNHKGSWILKWIFIICIVGSLSCSSLSNATMFCEILLHLFGINPAVTKLIMLIVVAVLLCLIVEPEKLKKFIYISQVIMWLLMCAFFIKNVAIARSPAGMSWERIPKWDISGFKDYFGNLNYAFEISSSYLNVRLIAKKEMDFNLLTSLSLMAIGFIYFANAASYLAAFNQETLANVDNSFNLYGNFEWYFKYSFAMYIPVIIYYFLMNTIFSTEMIETLPIIHKWACDGGSQMNRKRIVVLRMLTWSILVAISFGVKDVIEILNFAGVVINPMINSILPTLLFYFYAADKNISRSWFRKLHDGIFFGFGCGMLIWGVTTV